MIKSNKNNNGFTLIELLVVIAIIAVLASLGIMSYTGTQKRARDARRQNDLTQYRTSLVEFASKNKGLYPSYTASIDVCSGLTDDLGIDCFNDPRFDVGWNSYQYITSDGDGLGGANATDYSLWANLEGGGGSSYWILCSNGKVGELDTEPSPGGVCPI